MYIAAEDCVVVYSIFVVFLIIRRSSALLLFIFRLENFEKNKVDCQLKVFFVFFLIS